MTQQYESRETIAKVLGVCPATVDRWREQHNLPSYKFGKLVKFKLEEVEAWANAHKVAEVASK